MIIKMVSLLSYADTATAVAHTARAKVTLTDAMRLCEAREAGRAVLAKLDRADARESTLATLDARHA